MGVVFSDTFTGTNGTDLPDHTPDTGTGWTEEEKTGTQVLEIFSGKCEASNAEADDRATYSAQPDPTVVEYDVEFVFYQASGVNDEPSHLFARFTDTSNYYLATVYSDGQTDDYKLNKTVTGSFTELASLDEAIIIGGETIKLQVRDATKKVFNGETEKLTSTDNALTSAGKAGISVGNTLVSTDDIDFTQNIDDFKVTEQAVVADPIPNRLFQVEQAIERSSLF